MLIYFHSKDSMKLTREKERKIHVNKEKLKNFCFGYLKSLLVNHLIFMAKCVTNDFGKKFLNFN